MVNIGQKAPEFTLKDEGVPVSLKDFRGKKVVIYFYPKDNTPGCTKEACSFRDAFDEFLEAGAVVLGVSPDGEESHRNFRRRYGLPFHLLSDPDHQVAEAFGAWGEKNLYGRKSMGILRSTFIVDENGDIQNIFRKVRPEGHAREVLDALGGAQ